MTPHNLLTETTSGSSGFVSLLVQFAMDHVWDIVSMIVFLLLGFFTSLLTTRWLSRRDPREQRIARWLDSDQAGT
ncbi:hypothetical protein [Microbacterium resistens]|uniref:hypothetical protein n=1 Tax=Microbacterium resistens TaxID=156977 RepID=UPI0012FA8989|nr:hypothetical protein [Microbacterium resistens]